MLPFSALLRATLVAASLALSGAASAHPHVWVTARAELLYEGGKVRAVRHHWTFDEGYSAVAVQGLDTNGDGKTTPDELAELARTNIESLVDFGYFTSLKANGAKQRFGAPTNERMVYEKGQVTLSFDLPLNNPAGSRIVVLDVYDPTYFVDFRIADGDDAVTLSNGPGGCKMKITRPKPVTEEGKPLDEAAFQSLTATTKDFAADYSARAMAICP